MITIRNYLFLTWILVPLISQAVTDQYLTDIFGTTDGLPNNSISYIYKDSENFMWLGTWNGLARYDGYTFKTYTSFSHPELKNPRILNIREDGHGHLWISTYDKSLYLFDKQEGKFDRTNLPEGFRYQGRFYTQKGEWWLWSQAGELVHVKTDSLTGKVTGIHNHSAVKKERRINFIGEFSDKIYAGTSLGLYELNETPGKDKIAVNLLQGMELTCFCPSLNSDRIYLGSIEAGIFSFDSQNKQAHFLPHSQNIWQINSLQIIGDTLLMVGTQNSGLYLYDLVHEKIASHHSSKNNPEIISDQIIRITREENTRLWITTREPGIIAYDIIQNQFRYLHLDVPTNNSCISNIVRRYENKVIVNCYRQGVALYDPKKETIIPFNQMTGDKIELFSLAVHHILVDNRDNIWVSPWSKKLYKIRKLHNHPTLHRPENNSNLEMVNEVRAIIEDDQGNTWVGTRAGGVTCYDRTGNKTYKITHFTGLYGQQHTLNAIYSFMIRKNGEIWLGTKGNGILRINHGKAEIIDIPAMRYQQIYSLQEDSWGRIWIGCFGSGLQMLQIDSTGYRLTSNSEFINYPPNHHSIRQLTIDSHGRLWIGSTDGLLWVDTHQKDVTKSSFHTIMNTGKNEPLPGDVFSIIEDTQNCIWVGSTQGLIAINIMDRKDPQAYQITRYGMENGLPNNSIIALCQDHMRGLWIVTEDNICHFDLEKKRFYTYTEADGFPSLTFSEKSAYVNRKGEVMLGTPEGYLSFDPQQIVTCPTGFNVVFTDLHLANQQQEQPIQNGKVVLPYDHSSFTIQYAALDYIDPGNIHYGYKLEGIDTKWNVVGHERKLTYTNMAPGSYVLHVIASRDSAFTDEDPTATLQITILPPFWLTGWAKAGYLTLAIILLIITTKILSHYHSTRHRVQMEQEMQEMKFRFFTNISHELRTPMTLIQGPIEQLLARPEILPQEKEMLQYVERNVNKLMRMVNQILDFRKVQNDKMNLNPDNIELISLATNTFNNLEPAAKEKGLSFKFYPHIPSLHMQADAEKIDTILQNLLSNAIKFTPAGGDILLEISQNTQPSEVIISVIDSGIGISEELLPNLFERFSSSKIRHTEQYHGTGIGLNLTKSLVEMHGGSINAESSPGQGSRFTVRLPIIPVTNEENLSPHISTSPQISPQAPETTDPQNNHTSRILIVDDNPELRKFLRSVLQSNYFVFEADNGITGLKISHEQIPDLILSDIMMPEMDGIEFLRHIRTDISTSHIPFILLSAKSTVEDQILGLEYGADDYICKPFSSRLLEKKISGIFCRRALLYASLTGDKNALKLEPGEIVCQKRDEELLHKVIEWIENSMKEMNDFNIDILVRSIGLSRTVFYKKIKSLTGLSPVELIRDIRLKRGAQLASSGEYTVAEISTMIGFSDVRYFSRCFKQKYGVNPSEYKSTSNG